MGMFVEIAVAQTKFSTSTERDACVKSCPVDIFEVAGEQLVTVPELEDECILCGLCVAAAPSGAVSVRRLYGAQKPVEARSR